MSASLPAPGPRPRRLEPLGREGSATPLINVGSASSATAVAPAGASEGAPTGGASAPSAEAAPASASRGSVGDIGTVKAAQGDEQRVSDVLSAGAESAATAPIAASRKSSGYASTAIISPATSEAPSTPGKGNRVAPESSPGPGGARAGRDSEAATRLRGRAPSSGTSARRVTALISRPSFAVRGVPQDNVCSSLAAGWRSSACLARKAKMREALASPRVTALMAVCVVFALFGDDLRRSLTHVSFDPWFSALSFAVFVVFSIELIVNCVATPGYVNSFYFWLDLAATGTLVADVSWLYCNMFFCESFDDVASEARQGEGSNGVGGRPTRASTKAARVLRFVRLIRLVRIVKLYRHIGARRRNEASDILDVLQMHNYTADDMRARFKRIDVDRNNVLDRDEVAQLIRGALQGSRDRATAAGNAAAAAAAAPSEEEEAAMVEKFFTRLDKNGDGLIDWEEFEAEMVNFGDQQRRSAFLRNAKKNPSNIGQRLNEITTRGVILIVLAALFAVPLFAFTTYEPDPAAIGDYGLEQLHRFAQDWNVSADGYGGLQRRIVRQFAASGEGLLHLDVCPDNCPRTLPQATIQAWVADVAVPESGYKGGEDYASLSGIAANYRTTEAKSFAVAGCFDEDPTTGESTTSTTRHGCVSVAVFNVQRAARLAAVSNLLLTIFVMILLTGGNAAFGRAAHALVIRPIERMVDTVQQLAKTPLMKLVHRGGGGGGDKDGKRDGGRKGSAKYVVDEGGAEGAQTPTTARSQPASGESYETALLEEAVAKFSGLMQCGFGAAGSRIIAHNLASAGGEIDPMVPGRRVECVFGFCDIRDFTSATEVLQEDILLFVNSVASIVHAGVHNFGGSANKNIGDAFLLVWNLRPEDSRMLAEVRAGVSDAAVGSSGGTGGEASTPGGGGGGGAGAGAAEKGASTRIHIAAPGETKGVGHAAEHHHMPSVAEDALCAFLRVIVDMAHSPELHAIEANPKLQARFEHRGGFVVKMGFGLHAGYGIEGAVGSTFKIDATYLSGDVNLASRLEAATKQYGVPILLSEVLYGMLGPEVRRLCRKVDRVTVVGSSVPMALYTCDVTNTTYRERPVRFKSYLNIPELQVRITPAFRASWEAGIAAYLAGDWATARTHIEGGAMPAFPEDGPCATLMRVMGVHDFAAPRSWAGFRALDSK